MRPVWVRMRLHQCLQDLQAAVCMHSRLPVQNWVFTYCGQRCGSVLCTAAVQFKVLLSAIAVQRRSIAAVSASLKNL